MGGKFVVFQYAIHQKPALLGDPEVAPITPVEMDVPSSVPMKKSKLISGSNGLIGSMSLSTYTPPCFHRISSRSKSASCAPLEQESNKAPQLPISGVRWDRSK